MPLNPWKDFRTKSDANGQKSAAYWKTTYYIRDAQGNPMATYSRSSQNQEASYTLIERPIYGSSRVGIDNYSLEFVGYTAPENNLTNHILGLKQYELTNHLGNVLSTISDQKKPVDEYGTGTIDYYTADVKSSTDYYPFGSPMDGRTFSSEEYRFGFNGQEKDDEIKGSGNSYDFGARIYDSRLGRWLSLDPLQEKYPDLSAYVFVANSPLIFVDPDGKDIVIYSSAYDNNPIIYKPGMSADGITNKDVVKIINDLNYLHKTNTLGKTIEFVANTNKINVDVYASVETMFYSRINETPEGYEAGVNQSISYNPSYGLYNAEKGQWLIPVDCFGHEWGHLKNLLKDATSFMNRRDNNPYIDEDGSEWRDEEEYYNVKYNEHPLVDESDKSNLKRNSHIKGGPDKFQYYEEEILGKDVEVME
ncbi:MAG: RHS repeat-associated core domain-containing protein [Bacteroidales bacterium]|nr:RHS repeat-associated core domain-containing protein [Bacteroidales bacterium]